MCGEGGEDNRRSEWSLAALSGGREAERRNQLLRRSGKASGVVLQLIFQVRLKHSLLRTYTGNLCLV